MADIFISYKREDKNKVAPLAEALEKMGWSIWWDTRIRAGTSFDRVIEEELDNARSVVVVWSNSSVDSDWVRLEAGDGLEREVLISIAIEQGVRPPLRFRNIHTEPLINWGGDQSSFAFKKIVADLEEILDQPKDSEGVAPKEQMITIEDLSPSGKVESFIRKSKDQKKDHSELNTMVEIPAGRFIYQDGNARIEKPYLIDIYPVTNSQFKKFIETQGYIQEKYWLNKGNKSIETEGLKWLYESKVTEPKYWNNEDFNLPEHPVVGVSYYEAEAYANWAKKRLPTEKEWERAARGTDGRKFPYGNRFYKRRCNSSESRFSKTTPVTLYPNGISPVGCYDMAGNIWEWVSNWFDSMQDRMGLRGGSWRCDNRDTRCASRNGFSPDFRFDDFGFRCVMDIE